MKTLIMEVDSCQVRHTGGFMTILQLSGAEMVRKGNVVQVFYEIPEVEVIVEG